MAWTSALDRAPLGTLLDQHREAVAALQQELPSAFEAPTWLRYVLSFKTHEDRLQAARKAVAWRQEHRDLVDAATRRVPPPGLSEEELKQVQSLMLCGFHGSTAFGDPIFLIRAGMSNLPAILDALGDAKLEIWLTYLTECAFQYCEAATRHRRYFVKQISIQDLTGASMMPDRRFMRIMGRVSKMNEWLRPQLLGRMVIFNAPSWINLAFKIASTFLSKKTVSKVWIHGPKPQGALCPYARQLFGDPGILPTNFGGRCSCEDFGGCVGGRPNNCPNRPTLAQLTNFNCALPALRRLPAIDTTEDAKLESFASPVASTAAPEPPVPSACAEPVVEPQEPRQNCCRRCCGKRRPLAASVDAHV